MIRGYAAAVLLAHVGECTGGCSFHAQSWVSRNVMTDCLFLVTKVTYMYDWLENYCIKLIGPNFINWAVFLSSIKPDVNTVFGQMRRDRDRYIEMRRE